LEKILHWDFTTSKEIVDAWMKSPAHRKNIRIQLILKLAYLLIMETGKGTRSVLITQHFGKPSKTCPVVDEGIRATIKSDNRKTVTPIKKSIEARESGIAEASDTVVAEYNSLVITYNTLAKEVS
jgi:hypothetical protein